jgi:hypothetical protein
MMMLTTATSDANSANSYIDAPVTSARKDVAESGLAGDIAKFLVPVSIA